MIEIYTTPDCIYCHALMNWLDKLDVKYKEVDASNLKDIDSVPVTKISKGKTVIAEIVGFDRPAIKKALKELE